MRQQALIRDCKPALYIAAALSGVITSQVIQPPEAQAADTIPLIFDDDGSQDGFAALSYLLSKPEFDLQAITMSHGVARPESESFQTGLKQLLGRLEILMSRLALVARFL